jgi:hypothetical protein
MYSIHKKYKLDTQSQLSLKRPQNLARAVSGRDQLSLASKERLEKAIKATSDGMKNGKRYLVMKSGTIPCVHPLNHDFRLKSDCPNVYVRRSGLFRYKIELQRIKETVKDFRDTHLMFENDSYTPKPPSIPSSSSKKQ